MDTSRVPSRIVADEYRRRLMGMCGAELIEELGRALRWAFDDSKDQGKKAAYLALSRELWARSKAIPFDRPVVFMSHGSGHLTIGLQGKERIFIHPGLAGLESALRIFAMGGVSPMQAADFVNPSSTHPGNALREQLRDAADWVEAVARCPGLARCMRPPVISISTAGGVRFNAGLAPRLILDA